MMTFTKVSLSTSEKLVRGHTELNHGPLDLQSNALPLSYTPSYIMRSFCNIHILIRIIESLKV